MAISNFWKFKFSNVQKAIHKNVPLQNLPAYSKQYNTVVYFLYFFSENYNHYLETIGHSIGAGACVNVRRENTTPRITRKTPLFRFLPGETSDEKEEQRDFIFLVIEDIVSRVLICN